MVGVRLIHRRRLVGIVAIVRSVGRIVWLLLNNNYIRLRFRGRLGCRDLRSARHLGRGGAGGDGRVFSWSEVPGWPPEPGPVDGRVDHCFVQRKVRVPGRRTSVRRPGNIVS